MSKLADTELGAPPFILPSCGACRFWDSYEEGVGHCSRAEDPSALMATSGELKTRIEFACIEFRPSRQRGPHNEEREP